jgi:ATP-dependent Clp protease ATP-binding subunit ClpC
MIVRFDTSARHVLLVAREEARRLGGAGREYVGTEHLLLGLLRQKGGVPAAVIQALGIELHSIIAEVEKLIKRVPESSVVTGGFPQTPRVKRAVEYAIAEAEHLGYVGVALGHLFLGLLNDEDTVSATILSSLRPISEFRRETMARLGFRIDRQWVTWNDGAVGKIARNIDRKSRWDDCPILADALEEAGCACRGILDHFRKATIHKDRCSILDLLLTR